ncbi:hypothetical protein D3C84_1281480 [compost metagenome]
MGGFHLRREGIVLVRQRHDTHALGWNKGHVSAETVRHAWLVNEHVTLRWQRRVEPGNFMGLKDHWV